MNIRETIRSSMIGCLILVTVLFFTVNVMDSLPPAFIYSMDSFFERMGIGFVGILILPDLVAGYLTALFIRNKILLNNIITALFTGMLVAWYWLSSSDDILDYFVFNCFMFHITAYAITGSVASYQHSRKQKKYNDNFHERVNDFGNQEEEDL